MSSTQQTKEAKIEQMTLEDLNMLKKHLSEDLQTFLNSYNGLKSLQQKFDYSKVLVEQIGKKAKSGDDLMIPMTTSLYIPGKLKTNDKFLVELGTGYYAEFDGKQAAAYCSRKGAFTRDTSSQVEAQLEEKRKFLEKVNMKLQKRIQERHELLLK